jgi:hypothetical protein
MLKFSTLWVSQNVSDFKNVTLLIYWFLVLHIELQHCRFTCIPLIAATFVIVKEII